MTNPNNANANTAPQMHNILSQMKLFGAACQSLDNEPFLCNNLLAYARMHGSKWASMLAQEMKSRSASTNENEN